MILTTSLEWSDRPRRTFIWAIRSKAGPGPPGRRRGGEAVPFPAPLFDAKPLLASHRRHRPGWKMQERTFEARSAAHAEEESPMINGGLK